MPDTTTRQPRERRLSLLIMLLLALHILFGITGIIGVLVAHMSLESTRNTIYRSHLRWQITTFWIAFAGYAAAIWAWLSLDLLWPALIVIGFVAYRLFINLRHWMTHQPINRFF